MCHGKGYKTVNIDGKEVKITFHKFPDANRKNTSVKLKWLHDIRRDVGMSLAMFRCRTNTFCVIPAIVYNCL